MPMLVKVNVSQEEASDLVKGASPRGQPGASPRAMPLGRDIEAAREAFTTNDVQSMLAAHSHAKEALGAPEGHGGDSGDFIKSLVFGGLDGIITTFAIVSAAVGANLSHKTVIIMGLANLMADAISMGLGDALSEKAEMDYVKREYARENWEMDKNPAGEISEMVALYEAKGVATADALVILNTMAKYKEFFVDHMMVVEMGLMPPDPADSPWAKGAVTFVAFVAFGSVPLLSFIAANAAGAEGDLLFGMCILFTLLTIFTLGAVSGKFSQANIYSSGSMMMLNGGLAAAASYFIGWGLEAIVPEDV